MFNCGTGILCLVIISIYSAVIISKMLKYAEINILDITVEHLDIKIELLFSAVITYFSWTLYKIYLLEWNY